MDTAEALAEYEARLQDLNDHQRQHADVISEHAKLKARLHDAEKQVEKAAKAEAPRDTEGDTIVAFGSVLRVKATVVQRRAPDTKLLLKAWPTAFKDAPGIFVTTIGKLTDAADDGVLPGSVNVDDVCILRPSVKVTIEPNT